MATIYGLWTFIWYQQSSDKDTMVPNITHNFIKIYGRDIEIFLSHFASTFDRYGSCCYRKKTKVSILDFILFEAKLELFVYRLLFSVQARYIFFCQLD
jgi:hypothetical protein